MKKNKSKILHSLAKGDKKAFKLIFNTYYKRLYQFSLNYVEDRFGADEVVENVMIRLWQKRDKLDEINNLKSYLYTMTRNASLDYLKEHNKYERYEKEKHDTAHLMDQYIIEEETYAILFDALEKLPTKCRKVLELSCIQGLKYVEIAEDLQISLNTVKSQRNRAIKLLKKQLNKNSFFPIFLASL